MKKLLISLLAEDQLKSVNIRIQLTSAAHLAEKGFLDSVLGARPMARAISVRLRIGLLMRFFLEARG